MFWDSLQGLKKQEIRLYPGEIRDHFGVFVLATPTVNSKSEA